MRVLLDECTPRVVKKRLPMHDINTVQEMGWAGVKNGALLTLAAAAHFEVFITTDKNLRYQQKLTGRTFAVLLLPSNQVPVVERVLPAVEAALQTIRVGDYVEIPLP